MSNPVRKKDHVTTRKHKSPITRRRFLRITQAVAGGAALVGEARGGRLSAAAFQGDQRPPDPTKRQGQPARPYGRRSRFETAARTVVAPRHATETGSFTPLQSVHGIITPSSLHFERHHAGITDIDPDQHPLLIHGLVDQALVFSMSELKRFPPVSRVHFLECSGNGGTERMGARGQSVQEIHGLTSCSEWTGVPLRTLLSEVGVKHGAS